MYYERNGKLFLYNECKHGATDFCCECEADELAEAQALSERIDEKRGK